MLDNLFHRLLGRQYVETQLMYARRKDADLVCICGDKACDLPWTDGGKVAKEAVDGL